MRLDNRKIIVFLSLILFALLLPAFAAAIGISPADAYVNFIPNHEYVIDYSVTSYRPFEFYTEGKFSEYTRVETIHHSDRQGLFRVYLTLPAEYDTPGKHRLYIRASEKTSPGTVNTIAAIRGFIEIDVPYPGYYATMRIDVDDVNEGETVFIYTHVYNKGKLNISDARLKLSILSGNTVVKTFESATFGINTTGGYTFSKMIEGGELRPGTYDIEAELTYEGGTRTETESFRVGTFDVRIVNYTRQMYNNTVNPFFIELESLWNDPMKTVFIEMNLKNGTQTLSSVKTPPFDLVPWQKRNSTFYWNTAGIPVGEYDLEIILHYGDNVRTENRKIYIVEKPSEESAKPIPVSTLILVTIALLLIGFNIYFILKRRKDDDEDKKKRRGGGKAGKGDA